MMLNKTHFICFIVGAILGLLSGFFIGKGIYDQPIEESVKRDTVTIHDTIPHYYPQPVNTSDVKTVYKWLTAVKHTTDTIVKTDVVTLHDSVLVEVPITQKRYKAEEYDAYVSGYEPNLDSIFVYLKTQVITETITKTKQLSRWSLGFQAGYGYGFKAKALEPYVGIGVGFRIF